ncbi:(2Fe-2S)-binding protein [uncultured Castellaniella sp.]|uniref:(2Fe-2S)-binding protein n=1 Tax=uncultured Castellaniella sp. TaxID=647907 RepID=UPI00263975FD|nr:(2Fe-2S)-binding protein [uncultured Castellaniella sp.]
MYICVCNAISERQVQEAIAQGAADLSDLQATLGIATCCGQCADTATDYLPGGRYATELAAVPAVAPDRVVQAPLLTSTEIRRVA